ncbi:MAG: hypothetical protein AB7E13_11390, partial [Arcobacteraceae bacterium]
NGEMVNDPVYTTTVESLFKDGESMSETSPSGNKFSDGTDSGITITNIRRNADKSITFDVEITN